MAEAEALADKTDLLPAEVEVEPVVVVPVAKDKDAGQKGVTEPVDRRLTIPNALSNMHWNLMPTKMANSAPQSY